MIDLMNKKSELGIVNDQIGSPTSAHSLSRLLIKVIAHENFSGILHWSDGASVSWFEFAMEIQGQAFNLGLLKTKIPLKPIKTEQYPTPAKRPKYSVLERNCSMELFNVAIKNWKDELQGVITRMSEKIGS